jgi:hypothetical protein
MYFRVKKILKNNRNHILKHPLRAWAFVFCILKVFLKKIKFFYIFKINFLSVFISF